MPPRRYNRRSRRFPSGEADTPCRCIPIAAPCAATSLKRSRASPPSRRPSALNAAERSSASSLPLDSASKAQAGTSTTTRPRAPAPAIPLRPIHPKAPAIRAQAPVTPLQAQAILHPTPKRPLTKAQKKPPTSPPPRPRAIPRHRARQLLLLPLNRPAARPQRPAQPLRLVPPLRAILSLAEPGF